MGRQTGLHTSDERGSALVVVMFMMFGLAAMSMAHLTRVVADSEEIEHQLQADRLLVDAEGELEIAKNVVNAAPYLSGANTAITAALASTPPYVPGTEVRVERIGGIDTDWYRLWTEADLHGTTKYVEAYLRQREPVSAYNYFVSDHPLGISGSPVGMIHSNRDIAFYFADGYYRDLVTAVEGFSFVAGATEQNTVFGSGANPVAASKSILEEGTLADAAAEADAIKVTDDLIAEILLMGKTADVKLYRPRHQIEVPTTGKRKVVSHYANVTTSKRVNVYENRDYKRTVSVYEKRKETYQATVNVYERRKVEETRTRKVWVESKPDPSASTGGGAVATGSLGSWQNESYKVWVNRNVKVGTKKVTKTRTVRVKVGTKEVWRTKRVKVGTTTKLVTQKKPVYKWEDYTYFKKQWVPEQFVRKETVPSDGVMYFEREVRRLSGKLEGGLSIVSNKHVNITGSLQYVDADGDTFMNNGLDPTKPYELNPHFDGKAVLAVIAKNDITYSKDLPKVAEINGSLVSAEGKVAFDGIKVSSDGKSVTVDHRGLDPSEFKKDSLRRSGGIVTCKRPVTTYVTPSGGVLAGFARGQSMMDARLLINRGGTVTPPFIVERNEPLWAIQSSGRFLDR